MKTLHLFKPVFLPLLILFLMITVAGFAQGDVNRKLSVAVNGFDFNELAAKKAMADGADINQKNDAMGGETLLISAVKGFKDSKIFKFLIENGADISLRDYSNKTALDWAMQYNFGRNNNEREIIKLLGNVPNKPAAPVNNPPIGSLKEKPQPITRDAPVQNKTISGGPGINEIKQTVEKNLTDAYQNHFYGVINKVTFQWIGGIIIGQPGNNLKLSPKCYPAKLDVKITITDPRDGNTTTISRGMKAVIGGYHKTEIFCFFKNGFGEWDYGTYEQ